MLSPGQNQLRSDRMRGYKKGFDDPPPALELEDDEEEGVGLKLEEQDDDEEEEKAPTIEVGAQKRR